MDSQVIKISIFQKITYSKSFNRQKYNFKNLRIICEKAKHNRSLVKFKTLLVVGIKFDSQILAKLKKNKISSFF